MRHYLMTTDDHFDAAVNGGHDEAAQKAAQQAHAETRSEPQECGLAHKKTPVLLGFAGSSDFSQLPGMAGTGFEPATSRL